MHYDTIIIGAGPAGLFAASYLGGHNKKVLLLERNKNAGKKLLVSGAGQCNFTHSGSIEDFLPCYNDQGKFLKKALSFFTNKDTLRFFEQLGVVYQMMPNGKVFPKSMKSEEILNALLIACQKANVEIKYNSLVQNIANYDDIFTVETSEGHRYFSNQVIIATGGKSYSHLGSDGIGYELAQQFKHTIEEPKPALTDVRLTDRSYKCLSGLSVKDAEITIWRDNKKVKNYVGDLLFTHKGLSGPAIINSSRWMNSGDELTINFLYPQTYEEVRKYFTTGLSQRGKEEIVTFLRQFNLPKALLEQLCIAIGQDLHKPCAEISKTERENLVQALTKKNFIIEQLGGFNIAMVTTGGIKLKEVNPTTLESRKQKGLFFIGEVLDVDGDTGGYNIQAAFSTAALCAHYIANKK